VEKIGAEMTQPQHDEWTQERRLLAWNAGYDFGYKYGKIDYDGAYQYDGRLMASYLNGCRAGSNVKRAESENV
tara:strand:+ start:735 stop:953 length:219 start_codon:yes stop_codon:yes gene_type:complete